MKYDEVTDGKWFDAPAQWYHRCCDCGLSHRVEMQKTKGGYKMRWTRLRRRRRK